MIDKNGISESGFDEPQPCREKHQMRDRAKRRKWLSQIDDNSSSQKREFRKLYPQLTGRVRIWEAFNKGTEEFDLENGAVTWMIALGWLRKRAHMSQDGPTAEELQRFDKERRLSGTIEVEYTQSYLVWYYPAFGPGERGTQSVELIGFTPPSSVDRPRTLLDAPQTQPESDQHQPNPLLDPHQPPLERSG